MIWYVKSSGSGPQRNAEDHKKVIENLKSQKVDTDTAVTMTFYDSQEFRASALGKIEKVKIEKYIN